MKMNRIIIGISLAALSLAACQKMPEQGPNSEQAVAQTQERQTAELQAQVGLPRIPNGTEKRLATKIEEMRDDPNLLTYAYLQGMDGKLRCFGKGVGFGIPYSTQVTAPTKWGTPPDHYNAYESQQVPQAEPNGLYMPSAADATWYMLIDPKTGKATPTYVEPHLTVSTFPLTGSSVAEPC